ncbi:MAG: COP23 domain-containing protein [Iphinoe sp. HA4291-MV1]|jgi:hypothetical protein|nr:COP23 domain-containing protein [Iphinoe sp. HA4291-MV1]
MNLRKYQLTAQIIATIFMLSGTTACSSKLSASEKEPTVFNCAEQKGGWVTIAKRGEATSSEPIFNWQTKEFDEWTPERRCYHVSGKLTTIVAKNGGRLNGLNLTFGKVDSGETVICVINADQKDCDRQNMIFTLNKVNAKNPSLVLAKITNFAQVKGSDNTINEKGRVTQFVSLEALVNRYLERNDRF